MITRDEFFAWNPALNGNCDGLWANYYYCIAAYPAGVFPQPAVVTTKPSAVPNGQTRACTRWYEATDGDTCDFVVLIFAAFTKEDLIAWNPSLGSSCTVTLNLYYCVGVAGTPTTRTTTYSSTSILFPTDTVISNPTTSIAQPATTPSLSATTTSAGGAVSTPSPIQVCPLRRCIQGLMLISRRTTWLPIAQDSTYLKMATDVGQSRTPQEST